MADTVSRRARRRFLKLASAGLAAAPFCGACVTRLALAQERVEENEEMAQQLGYKHDASQVDPNEWPDYQEGHTCANCQLYHGEEGAEWGPCDIFGGKGVSAKGWCMSWIEKEA
jgi:High potential iron-sulfur protein